jgi:hypothetical protein
MEFMNSKMVVFIKEHGLKESRREEVQKNILFKVSKLCQMDQFMMDIL